MRHFIGKENVGISCSRGKEVSGAWEHILATNQIIQHHTVSMKETNYLFPLYLYKFTDGKKLKANQFEELDPFEGKERIENLTHAFRKSIDDKYGKHYEPEQILGYIYAVLYSPTYRSKYIEFLKTDFPRIPFVDDKKIFEKLSALGWQLVQAHLLKEIPTVSKVDINKADMRVEKPVYDEIGQRLYFNKNEFFSSVPKNVWEFYIGGYQVLDKYLKSRIGLTLTLDEIENIQNVVNALIFTITRMQEIEEAWKP